MKLTLTILLLTSLLSLSWSMVAPAQQDSHQSASVSRPIDDGEQKEGGK